jgi:competence protein ComEA
MDRSASPWHALDGGAGTPDPDNRRDHAPVRWPVVGVVVAALGLALVALGLVITGPQPTAVVGVGVDPIAAVQARGPSPSSSPAAAQLVVHVSGAVRRPGIVRLPAGSRVADAIDAAGGLGPRVDAGRFDRELNLAAIVADGDHIIVPSRDDPGAAAGAGSSPAASGSGGGKIDLNHASAEALDSLPGIGPVTAAKIIAAREERPFTSLDELVSRKVLGQATLAKIRDLAELR